MGEPHKKETNTEQRELRSVRDKHNLSHHDTSHLGWTKLNPKFMSTQICSHQNQSILPFSSVSRLGFLQFAIERILIEMHDFISKIIKFYCTLAQGHTVSVRSGFWIQVSLTQNTIFFQYNVKHKHYSFFFCLFLCFSKAVMVTCLCQFG